jgi:putative ABC transport system substrate-binding protein
MILALSFWRTTEHEWEEVAMRIFKLIVVWAALCGLATLARAQQAAKTWKIGMLASSSAALNASRDEGLRQGLREFGYVEGKNIVLDFKYADGKLERLPELAAELVRANPDVIIVGGTRVAVAVKKATATIPIVLAGAGDPVRAGLVASYMRPGANVTGVARLSPDFIGNRVGLLKQAVPKASRMAVLSNSDNPGHGPALKDIELGASAWGMRLRPVSVRGPKDFAGVFSTAVKEGADAFFVLPDALFHNYAAQIVELAAKHRLPAMYDRSEFVEAGGLMSYGVNVVDLSQRAAWYVDQIFKGAKPGELPLVEPTRSELVINANAAKQLGLSLPPELLARANKVIR